MCIFRKPKYTTLAPSVKIRAYTSSEHAYQYIDKSDLAEEVLKAPTAAEAKSIASCVPIHLHKDWHSIKKSVMKEIIHIKADYCASFKQSLLDSASCRIVEAVQGDLYWSSGLSPYLAKTTKPQFYPGMNELGAILETVRFELMREAILSREFELHDYIYNGVQPLTDNNIEPDITTLSTGVSESFDLPPPPLVLTILHTDHNSHDNENLPPPPLLPTELTLSNELVHDVVHHSNNDEDNQNSSLKTTHVNKIALPDTEDHSIIASGKIKSVKERNTVKINRQLHPTIVRKMVQRNTNQRLCRHSICSNGSCLLTRRLTRPRIMSKFLGVMTAYHSNSIIVVRLTMVLDAGFLLK